MFNFPKRRVLKVHDRTHRAVKRRLDVSTNKAWRKYTPELAFAIYVATMVTCFVGYNNCDRIAEAYHYVMRALKYGYNH
jgi:hypothetical protein